MYSMYLKELLHVLPYHMFGLDFNNTQTPANILSNAHLSILFKVLRLCEWIIVLWLTPN